jgi:hypothetical protein
MLICNLEGILQIREGVSMSPIPMGGNSRSRLAQNDLIDLVLGAVNKIDKQSKSEFEALSKRRADYEVKQQELARLMKQLRYFISLQGGLEEEVDGSGKPISFRNDDAFNTMRQIHQNASLEVIDYEKSLQVSRLIEDFATIEKAWSKHRSVLGIQFGTGKYDYRESIASPRLCALSILLMEMIRKEGSEELKLLIVRERLIATVDTYLRRKLIDKYNGHELSHDAILLMVKKNREKLYDWIAKLRENDHTALGLEDLYASLEINDSKDVGMERLRQLLELLSKTESSKYQGDSNKLSKDVSSIVTSVTFNKSTNLLVFWGDSGSLVNFERLWGDNDSSPCKGLSDDIKKLIGVIKSSRPYRMQAQFGGEVGNETSIDVFATHVSVVDKSWAASLVREYFKNTQEQARLRACIEHDDDTVKLSETQLDHINQAKKILGPLKTTLNARAGQDVDLKRQLHAHFKKLTKFNYDRIGEETESSLSYRVRKVARKPDYAQKIEELVNEIADRKGKQEGFSSELRLQEEALKTSDQIKLCKLKDQVYEAHKRYLEKKGVGGFEKTFAHGKKGKEFARTFKDKIKKKKTFHDACKVLTDHLEKKEVLFLDGSFASFLLEELFLDKEGVFYSVAFDESWGQQMMASYYKEKPAWSLFNGYSKEVGDNRKQAKTTAINALQQLSDDFDIEKVAKSKVPTKSQSSLGENPVTLFISDGKVCQQMPQYKVDLDAPDQGLVHIKKSPQSCQAELQDEIDDLVSQVCSNRYIMVP